MEKEFCFRWMALSVLLIFYAVYFIKMWTQKKETYGRAKIGRRKEKTMHRVKMLISVATLGIVAAQLLSLCLGWNHMPKTARYIGFSVGLAGDAVFRRRCFA